MYIVDRRRHQRGHRQYWRSHGVTISLLLQAYDTTLGLLHAWLVRTGIKAGMIGLPSREHFLQSIGETEDTAKEHGEGFIEAADTLCMAISSLYVDVKMPVSDFKIGWG